VLSKTTDEAGRTVRRVADETGSIVEQTLSESGEVSEEAVVGEASTSGKPVRRRLGYRPRPPPSERRRISGWTFRK
jgi:hypothetical protein